MTLDELFEGSFDDIIQHLMIESAVPIYAKSKNKIVKKYRCISGAKKGRIVSDPAICSTPINLKKRQTLKKVLKSKGARIKRKTAKTKRTSAISKQVKLLNKRK